MSSLTWEGLIHSVQDLNKTESMILPWDREKSPYLTAFELGYVLLLFCFVLFFCLVLELEYQFFLSIKIGFPSSLAFAFRLKLNCLLSWVFSFLTLQIFGHAKLHNCISHFKKIIMYIIVSFFSGEPWIIRGFYIFFLHWALQIMELLLSPDLIVWLSFIISLKEDCIKIFENAYIHTFSIL